MSLFEKYNNMDSKLKWHLNEYSYVSIANSSSGDMQIIINRSRFYSDKKFVTGLYEAMWLKTGIMSFAHIFPFQYKIDDQLCLQFYE